MAKPKTYRVELRAPADPQEWHFAGAWAEGNRSYVSGWVARHKSAYPCEPCRVVCVETGDIVEEFYPNPKVHLNRGDDG